MSYWARFGDRVLQKGINKVEGVHGVLISEMPELAMMGSACSVAHVEGMLCVTSGGGQQTRWV